MAKQLPKRTPNKKAADRNRSKKIKSLKILSSEKNKNKDKNK